MIPPIEENRSIPLILDIDIENTVDKTKLLSTRIDYRSLASCNWDGANTLSYELCFEPESLDKVRKSLMQGHTIRIHITVVKEWPTTINRVTLHWLQ